MLLKLLKYDFRAMWKQFSLIWGTALALGVINRFTLDGQGSTSLVGETTSEVVQVLLVLVFMTMFIITCAFAILRFSKGLLGDEGYLMHTLPVQPWQLVVSKLVCAAATFTASVVVSFLAILLMYNVDFSDLLQIPLWRTIVLTLKAHPDVLLLAAEFALLEFSLLALGLAMVYLAMALGHLFLRRRALMSVVAFLGLNVLTFQFYARLFNWNIYQVVMDVASGSPHSSLLAAAALMLFPAVLFLAGTIWILGHRLNLE